ncbi:MAG: hypothetical protein KAG96_04235 [Ichthyobacteriaceae bacterium]|nr:hypothetical protein [Ichthyobacteriaceae bacterium]
MRNLLLLSAIAIATTLTFCTKEDETTSEPSQATTTSLLLTANTDDNNIATTKTNTDITRGKIPIYVKGLNILIDNPTTADIQNDYVFTGEYNSAQNHGNILIDGVEVTNADVVLTAQSTAIETTNVKALFNVVTPLNTMYGYIIANNRDSLLAYANKTLTNNNTPIMPYVVYSGAKNISVSTDVPNTETVNMTTNNVRLFGYFINTSPYRVEIKLSDVSNANNTFYGKKLSSSDMLSLNIDDLAMYYLSNAFMTNNTEINYVVTWYDALDNEVKSAVGKVFMQIATSSFGRFIITENGIESKSMELKFEFVPIEEVNTDPITL